MGMGRGQRELCRETGNVGTRSKGKQGKTREKPEEWEQTCTSRKRREGNYPGSRGAVSDCYVWMKGLRMG